MNISENQKLMVQFCFKSFYKFCKSKHKSWAADGQDGNGLHLEKSRLIFFKFIASSSVLENSLKLSLRFIFSSKIHLIYFS